MERAKESAAVKRSRRKIREKFEEERKKMTKEALNQVSQTIQYYIQRHNAERVSLKGKLELFDENRHSVETQSQFVRQLAERLGRKKED